MKKIKIEYTDGTSGQFDALGVKWQDGCVMILAEGEEEMCVPYANAFFISVKEDEDD